MNFLANPIHHKKIARNQRKQESLKSSQRGKDITFREATVILTANFSTEVIESNNCKLKVLLYSVKILFRNEDSLLFHLTKMPTEGNTKGRKKISGGRSRMQEGKKSNKSMWLGLNV